MKAIYCAKCGKELPIILKGMPKHGTIVRLIAPHRCGKIAEPNLGKESPLAITAGEKENGYEFVQKLNELEPPGPGDKRDEEHLRKELKSTAPENLLDKAKLEGFTQPEDNEE